MYWDGSSINFATAGSRRFDINAGGADVTGALTASGALTVSGASNSSFVGNVGIGTTNPGYKLDVNGTIHGYNGRLLIEQGNTGWGMFRVIPTQTNVQVDAMDSTQVTPLNLVFNPNGGNVGIGTTTPNSILNIAGATPKLTLTDTSAGANLKHWFVQSNAGALRFATTSDALADNSLAAMTITSSGGVGIGTASPGVFRLNVTGGDNNNLIGSVNPSGSSMRIQANAAANYVQGAGNVPLFIANSGANGFIAFYPNDVERVRITTGGNVGIGTTSPSQALSVQGNGLFSGNVYPVRSPSPAR
ncbi:MAG: hypothetical protein NT108_02795 [Candidatus Kaiserbacteria bacterium]|nr:hypothetical protein [Candidatus Kaiserbacteria bacterium]